MTTYVNGILPIMKKMAKQEHIEFRTKPINFETYIRMLKNMSEKFED